ncbi:hypothetical protein Sjap_022576 [Stephania japonica]|uniref:Uncharacterized protein n=1 Tax=Stephania japonica TaxID=461633 RepID=A0AAP0HT05_9MAGN
MARAPYMFSIKACVWSQDDNQVDHHPNNRSPILGFDKPLNTPSNTRAVRLPLFEIFSLRYSGVQ